MNDEQNQPPMAEIINEQPDQMPDQTVEDAVQVPRGRGDGFDIGAYCALGKARGRMPGTLADIWLS